VRFDRLPVALPTFIHVTLHCQGLAPTTQRGSPLCAVRGLLRERDLLGRE